MSKEEFGPGKWQAEIEAAIGGKAPLAEAEIVRRVAELCQYMEEAKRTLYQFRTPPGKGGLEVPDEGDFRLLWELIQHKVNVTPYVVTVLEKGLERRPQDTPQRKFDRDWVGFFSLSYQLNYAIEFLDQSTFERVLQIIKELPRNQAKAGFSRKVVLKMLPPLIDKRLRCFRPQDFEAVLTLLKINSSNEPLVALEIELWKDLQTACERMEAFREHFDCEAFCAQLVGHTLSGDHHRYSTFLDIVAKTLFRLVFAASPPEKQRQIFAVLIRIVYHPKWDVRAVGWPLLEMALEIYPELFTQKEMDGVLKGLLGPSAQETFDSATSLFELAGRKHPHFALQVIPFVKEHLAKMEGFAEGDSKERTQALYDYLERAFSLVEALFRAAPRLAIPDLWGGLLQKLDAEDGIIVERALFALQTAFEAAAEEFSGPLQMVHTAYASPDLIQRLAAVQAFRTLLEATPWFLDSRWSKPVRQILEYADDPYMYGDLKDDIIRVLERVLEATERWFNPLPPLFFKLLQEGAKEVLQEVLKLLRHLLERVSLFLSPFCYSVSKYSDWTQGWMENKELKAAYKAMLRAIPTHLDSAAMERLSEFFLTTDREVQAMALYLGELALTYTPAHVTPAFVTNLEALATQPEKIPPPIILALYQKLGEQRPELFSRKVVAYIGALLSANFEYNRRAEGDGEDLEKVAREFFPFRDHEGGHRDDLEWYGAYWDIPFNALCLFQIVFAHTPEFISQAAFNLIFQYLLDPSSAVRQEAYTIYRNAVEDHSQLLSPGPLRDPPLFQQLVCPKCGKQIIQGMVEGVDLPDHFGNADWVKCSMEDLLGVATLTCESCKQAIPLRQFPKTVQDFWIALELAPTNEYYATRYAQMREIKIVIVNESKYQTFIRDPIQNGTPSRIPCGLSWFDLLQYPGEFGVELYCQACNRQLVYGDLIWFLEWDAVIECIYCRAFIQLKLPEGLKMPEMNKE